MSESDLPELPRLTSGRYRHYKGGEYEVMAVARHSETLEAVVVYRPLYNDSGWWVRPFEMFTGSLEVVVVYRPLYNDSCWWVRPYEMFTGTLEVDGVVRPRFERIG